MEISELFIFEESEEATAPSISWLPGETVKIIIKKT
jgi:hypothetical protein